MWERFSTFSSRLVGGFAVCVALTVLTAVAGMSALTSVTASKDDVIASADRLLSESRSLSTIVETRIGDYRGYLLTGSADYVAALTADREQFLATASRLRPLLHDRVTLASLDDVLRAEVAYTAALDISERHTGLASVKPAREALQRAIAGLTAGVRGELDRARTSATRSANRAVVLLGVLCALAVAAAAVIAVRLSRGLRREVGAAVGHIRASSAQLETAAAQQVSGGRDQAAAINEITTTIDELLVSSRQIAGNAQRVSKIAEDTAEAARTGDTTIDLTRQSIAVIRSQVDDIMRHMRVLGEKSVRIGGVAGLAAELAEQTNILAINATIEAAGAGEWGRRFGVVAVEIRKLADRTADSAKEIRELIEEVRGAVSTTVHATESGTLSVDSGVRQVDDATASFRRIAQLVSTADQATMEIELSTRQQSTAVEQVATAASDTARVSRETEASAVQTRQTAAHLAVLSTDLQRLVGGYPGPRTVP
ncbi:hypothetical protein ACTI_74740 [Actinoplanes sp. OR16]|uniref:methyl-accepting chemotaxis protein n=1 Tax=Actinoplanes sp. OR16 TaxID=946334 RepID=UPI000F6F422E|nr:methyl-accepting chemotaxis protein [Actinoplanes sp. OR16]BBH70789.1 hypothetical protein ACTI_74740 [Actinoplanes sp. OR16]